MLRSGATIELDKGDYARVTLGLKALDQNLKPIIRHNLTKATHAGARAMIQHVPKRSGRMAGSIRAKDVPLFEPGGARGGGQYQTIIEAGEGVPYFDFVVKGTGIYGPHHKPWFQEKPADVYGKKSMWKAKHEGQKPQAEWIDKGVQAAWDVLVDATRRLDKELRAYKF